MTLPSAEGAEAPAPAAVGPDGAQLDGAVPRPAHDLAAGPLRRRRGHGPTAFGGRTSRRAAATLIIGRAIVYCGRTRRDTLVRGSSDDRRTLASTPRRVASVGSVSGVDVVATATGRVAGRTGGRYQPVQGHPVRDRGAVLRRRSRLRRGRASATPSSSGRRPRRARVPGAAFGLADWPMSEDCLSLNVWTPGGRRRGPAAGARLDPRRRLHQRHRCRALVPRHRLRPPRLRRSSRSTTASARSASSTWRPRRRALRRLRQPRASSTRWPPCDWVQDNIARVRRATRRRSPSSASRPAAPAWPGPPDLPGGGGNLHRRHRPERRRSSSCARRDEATAPPSSSWRARRRSGPSSSTCRWTGLLDAQQSAFVGPELFTAFAPTADGTVLPEPVVDGPHGGAAGDVPS